VVGVGTGKEEEGNVMGIIGGRGRCISKLDVGIKYMDEEMDILTSFQQ
jgi:hypothetical protein